VVAVETNILVYAHLSALPFHPAAHEALMKLAAGSATWCIPWPCVHEFCSVVSNPKAFDPCLDAGEALLAIDTLRKTSRLKMIGPGPEHLEVLLDVIRASGARGGAIHDARIAAVCIEHGVDEIWTADRDFLRFPGIRVRNPLIG
jgi:toxin-antitoxin system PIN domain toxin